MLVLKSLGILLPLCNLMTLSIALPTADVAASSSESSKTKRVEPSGDTTMEDADKTIPPPISYADWMKNLYDMGGGKVRRDDQGQYTTSVSQEEIDAWRLEMEGSNGYGREVLGD